MKRGVLKGQLVVLGGRLPHYNLAKVPGDQLIFLSPAGQRMRCQLAIIIAAPQARTGFKSLSFLGSKGKA